MIKFIFCVFLLSISVNAQTNSAFDIARSGSIAEIEQLYQNDKTIVDLIDSNGFNMLILACYRGNHDVANFLIDHNADLNYTSTNGTALMACVVKNELELADSLLQNRANVDLADENGITPLMLAVQIGNIEMVKKMLDANANRTLKCKDDKTAFEYAAFSTNESILTLLNK